MTEVATIEHRVEKAEENVRQAEVCLYLIYSPYSSDSGEQEKRIKIENQVAVLEEEVEALGDVSALTARKEELGGKSKANKAKLTSLRVRF